jgi:hypothetical protein
MEERRDLHIDSLSNTFKTKNISNIKLYLLESKDFSDVESVG